VSFNTCLLGFTLEELQPLLFLWDDVYIKTKRPVGQVVLVTASRVEHRMIRFCSIRNLADHHKRVIRPFLIRKLQQEIEQRKRILCIDPFYYFLHYLVPLSRELALSTEPSMTQTDHADQHDLPSRISGLVDQTPLPKPPNPSLWLLGRFWYLDDLKSLAGRMHVRFGKRTLGLTGEYSLVNTLQIEWQREVDLYLKDSAASINRETQEKDSENSDFFARNALSQKGWLQEGDLLYIDGNPPRLGHVIPAHYNRTLKRQSDRDLAVTATLELPQLYRKKNLRIFQKKEHPRGTCRDGEWTPVTLPNGLCLGREPEGAMQSADWSSAAAYLRWAAVRIAGNGRFHGND